MINYIKGKFGCYWNEKLSEVLSLNEEHVNTHAHGGQVVLSVQVLSKSETSNHRVAIVLSLESVEILRQELYKAMLTAQSRVTNEKD